MRSLRTAIAGLATLALTGCAGHTHSIVPDESDPGLTVGAFHHEGPEGPAMMLELHGKRFEASGFAIQRNQNLAELRRRYGRGKHYDRIFSGIDTDHYVYTSEPALRAADGATLRCSLAWRSGGAPAGACITAEGTRIDVSFQ